MISRMLIAAATLAAAGLAANAAQAVTPDSNQYEVCAVYGVTVDPRFCADNVDPAALWVDPFVTGGTQSNLAIPPIGLAPMIGIPSNATGHADGLRVEVPASPTGHADGVRVEGLRP